MSKKVQRQILALIALLIVAGLGLGGVTQVTTTGSSGAGPVKYEYWYPVTKIVDGDTIDVQIDGSTVRVRLIGLDTPESVDPRHPVQCFGKEAAAQMTMLVQGNSVRLETDETQSTYDKYGRLLAYVYAPANTDPDGILINKYMISEGYGHEYTYGVPYKYQADFIAAEDSARESQKGLWAPGVCDL